jgi:hypothetical protein
LVRHNDVDLQLTLAASFGRDPERIKPRRKRKAGVVDRLAQMPGQRAGLVISPIKSSVTTVRGKAWENLP